MAVAETLVRLDEQRELWLYDTFDGMTKPLAVDVDYNGKRELDDWSADQQRRDIGPGTSENEVRAAVERTGYATKCVTCVVGPVESTIP